MLPPEPAGRLRASAGPAAHEVTRHDAPPSPAPGPIEAPPARAPRVEPDVPEAAHAWALRGAWAGGWEVVATTRHGIAHRGRVEHVAATDAFALLWDGLGAIHLPIGWLRSVRRPHFHEDSSSPVPARRRAAVALPAPGQLALALDDGRPAGWVDPRDVSQTTARKKLQARPSHAR